jgi:hypothetical protein
VHCLFLDIENGWVNEGMEVGSIDSDTIECRTDHLSTFTVVLLDPKVNHKEFTADKIVLSEHKRVYKCDTAKLVVKKFTVSIVCHVLVHILNCKTT